MIQQINKKLKRIPIFINYKKCFYFFTLHRNLFFNYKIFIKVIKIRFMFKIPIFWEYYCKTLKIGQSALHENLIKQIKIKLVCFLYHLTIFIPLKRLTFSEHIIRWVFNSLFNFWFFHLLLITLKYILFL